jgi:hypothetical protein
MAVERDEKGRLKKGSVLNPSGRRADVQARLTAMLSAVSDEDIVAIMQAQVRRARKGNTRAAEFVCDRLFGKAVQRQQIGGEDGREIVFQIVRRSAED